MISDELRPQMMKWIAKDQRAYVKNRRIEVNTATIAILIQRCLENDEGEKDNYIEELERLTHKNRNSQTLHRHSTQYHMTFYGHC